MTCSDAQTHLREFLDSEMQHSARTPLRRHLDSCARCRRKLEVVRSLAGAVSAAGRREAPPSLLPRLRSRIAELPAIIAPPSPPPAPAGGWIGFVRRPAGAALVFGALAACGYTLLDRVLELNRGGKWEEAARAGEKLSQAPGRTDAEKCGALISAAYARVRLDDAPAAKKLLDTYDASCSDTGGWFRSERDKLVAELSAGTAESDLHRALEMNRSGRWKEAGTIYASVEARRDATHEQRCEAILGSAYSRVRLGEKQPAVDLTGRFDGDCSDLSKGHWLNGNRARLAKDLARTRQPSLP